LLIIKIEQTVNSNQLGKVAFLEDCVSKVWLKKQVSVPYLFETTVKNIYIYIFWEKNREKSSKYVFFFYLKRNWLNSFIKT
jgi:hypothetical protein